VNVLIIRIGGERTRVYRFSERDELRRERLVFFLGQKSRGVQSVGMSD
jgi:hypothetical protein